MPIRKISPNLDGRGRRVGIVLSRFNGEIGERLLRGALRALGEQGVVEADVMLVTVDPNPITNVLVGASLTGNPGDPVVFGSTTDPMCMCPW